LSDVRRNRTFIISLWLLLAAILGHALIPVGSPFVRTAGSAFSTSTVDVSLGGARGEIRGGAEQAVEPAAASAVRRFPTPAAAAALDTGIELLSSSAPRPFDARGPPAPTS
jgi:hypothetical protein